MRIPRLERKTWVKIYGVIGGLILVLILIIALAPESEGQKQERMAEERREAAEEAETKTVGFDENLAETALHAGKFVTWYVDQMAPLCEEYYAKSSCRVAVWELKKGEPCGAMPVKRLDWPARLPDGEFYLVQMESATSLTGYRQISSGARHGELPEQEAVFRCWGQFGIMQ